MNAFFQRINPWRNTEGYNANYRIILIESIFLGALFSSDPFISVFMARLGASTFEVSLLTSMTAIGGLFFTIPIGIYLQRQKKIVPWYSFPRLVYAFSIFLVGVVPFFFRELNAVVALLIVWGLAILPQNILMVTYTVIMNSVAGPKGRYTLMASRWGLVGLVSAVMIAITGWFLDQVPFPLNYQILFIFCSLFGLLAFAYSRRIQLPESTPPETTAEKPQGLKERIQNGIGMVQKAPSFFSFTAKRFLSAFGLMMVYPLFPLYFVREVHASDSWIGIINTAQTGITVLGYFFWMRQAKIRRDPFVILLVTTFVTALYPILLSTTHSLWLITLFAGAASFFQAGLDLAIFDEMLKNIPAGKDIAFISISQLVINLASMLGPMIGSFLADHYGIALALIVGGGLRLVAFGLFFLGRKKTTQSFSTN